MSGELNLLDFLFLLVLFFSFFFGILRGLTRELLALLFLVAALALAFYYYREVGVALHRLIYSRELADFAGFLLVLALVAAAGSFISHLVGRHLIKGPLKAVDRLLGAVFGLLRGILLSGLVIYSFLAFPLDQELLDRSQLAPVLTHALAVGIGVLPPALREKLKVIKIHDQQKNKRISGPI
jgi:membrane protein required for colicin V production